MALSTRPIRINFKNVIRFCRNISLTKNIGQIKSSKQKWTKLGLSLAILGCGGATFYYTRPAKERRFVRITIGGVGRFFRSSYIATRISLNYMWSTYGLSEDDYRYVETLERVHRQSAEQILEGCLRNGGLYVKLGQGLVIMDHILPKEYIDTLRVLQDKCLAREPSEVHQLFLEDFGKTVNEIFDSFDEVPIAAASLAQVFKAKTKTGEDVAVKAQYLDLQDRFVGDVTTLTILLKIAAWLHPDFDFAWVLNELKGTLEKELNFLNEAQNSEQCAKDLKHFPFVYVPKVLWELSSTRVLTTDWIDGIKISETEKLKEKQFSLADIDYKLFTTFAEQIFHTGFVHADPHPGNILIRKGRDNKAQLVLLDHGLYERVPNDVRESLRHLWKDMVLNDHAGMKKYSMELGVDEKDYRLFCIALGQRYIPSPDPRETDEDIVRLFFARQTSTLKRKRLTKQERAKLELELIALRNRCLNIFKSIPSKLMLVTRMSSLFKSLGSQCWITSKIRPSMLHYFGFDRSRTLIHCQNYRTLAEILTQVPQHQVNIVLIQKLSKLDMEILVDHAQNHFDKIMVILRQLPHNILLVIRNINAIRSIARGHGDPINRYKVMARCATQGTFVGYSDSSKFGNIIKNLKERIHFEIQLWWGGWKVWLITNLVKMVEFFGGINIHGLAH